MEDFGLASMKKIINGLKQWTDPWANPQIDVKFGMDYLTCSVFVVTSNYRLDDFDLTAQDLAALQRRFEVIHFPGP